MITEMSDFVEIRYRILPEMKEGVAKLKAHPKVSDLLRFLGISPDSVVVTVNDEVVPDDHVLSKDDKIVIYRVVSGG